MPDDSDPQKAEIGTSSFHWFTRGLVGGVMLVAAANALSYFFRTPGIADLIGSDTHVSESLGFPFEIWREDKLYNGSMFLDYGMVGLNLLVGMGLGIVFGLIGLALKPHFNRWVAEFESRNQSRPDANFQFSVKSLMLMTAVAAVFLAALTNWKGTPEALIAIYFFGPLFLIVIAMMPKRLHWKHRIVVLSITAFAMIGIAVWSGLILGVAVDRVLLGIFVSWTPQSAFGAFALTVGLIIQSFRKSETVLSHAN